MYLDGVESYMKLKLLVVLCTSLLVLLLVPSFTKAQEQLIVEGVIKDVNGNPISNAVVFAYDGVNITAYTTSDDLGRFKLVLPGATVYQIYVIHFNETTYRADYLPVKFSTEFSDTSHVYAEIVMYPSAYVGIRGRCFYIGGHWVGSYMSFVFSVDGKEISSVLDAGEAKVTRIFGGVETVKPIVIDSYGDTEDMTLAFSKAIRLGIFPSSVISRTDTLIPANIPVMVKFAMRIYDIRKRILSWFYFFVGSSEAPIVLERGAFTLVDVTKESLKQLIIMMRNMLRDAETTISNYERIGFYLGIEREDLSTMSKLVDTAETIVLEGGDPYEAYQKLERVFVYVTDTLPKRLKMMELIAQEGAAILPVFLSVFALSLAFYFHEQTKRKVITYVLLYLFFIILFWIVYPGAVLLWNTNKKTFASSIGASFIIPSIITFVLPNILKEVSLPGTLERGALISITFSLAKRYSRVRKLRTVITVFSIATLIWAFTVFASIGRAYGMKMDHIPLTYDKPCLLIKHVVKGSLEPLSYFSDYEWFVSKPEVDIVIPRAMTYPKAHVTVVVEHGRRKYIAHAILGLAPEEDQFTGISNILTSGKYSDISSEDSILLPSSAAEILKVKVGDLVNITVTTRLTSRITKATLKVVGIFSEESLDAFQDVDGSPLKPLVILGEKAVPANATDIVIVNWRFLLFKVIPEPISKISQVSDIYSLVVLAKDPSDLLPLAKAYIERKGSDFYAYVIMKAGSLVVYFGQKMESLFAKSLAFVVPIVIVGFNVAITMYSIIYERRREIYLLFALGLNPAQIAMLFLAESMIYGLLGGGIGYISGLTTFRVLSAIAASKNLIIKEKLEWYWSVISVVVAIIASMIASFRPAMQAAYMFVPSMIKRIKAAPEVRERRKEEITKITTEKTYGYDIHISLREAPVFFSYVYSRLQDLTTGYLERVEDLRELEEKETPSGKRVKEFRFRYIVKTDQGDIIVNNVLTITKMPGFDYYMVELRSKPASGLKVPVKYLDRVAVFINDILKDWERERKLMGF
ncbi:MAG: hypothetical protein DRZ82_06400 [Thermoprotei archaeon]|nr:MAG: hypothetical protein DRZ82_06400 [Thermoprotei archaeon]